MSVTASTIEANTIGDGRRCMTGLHTTMKRMSCFAVHVVGIDTIGIHNGCLLLNDE